jgi:transposase
MNQASATMSFDAELLPPMSATSSVVPTLEMVAITQHDLTELKWRGAFYKAQWEAACKREEVLKKEVEKQKGQLRDLKHLHFGKKSEAGGKKSEAKTDETEAEPIKRPRGQQLGSSGHGRTERPNLPVVPEHHELHGKVCVHCNLPYDPFPGNEESNILEIEVKAHVRRIILHRYHRKCSCSSTPNNPKIITAPPPPKLVPKSTIGISLFVQALISKFLYGLPLNRILSGFSNAGMPMSAGTLTDALQKISPLFTPIQEAFYTHQMTELWFHNDESRWKVYILIEGKTGHLWWLWVTRSPHVVYFTISSTRSASVPIEHFASLQAAKVILVCDRYGAYKKLARLDSRIVLAFCWVHVRRDFKNLDISYPHLGQWGNTWVQEIGTLYYINKQRLVYWQKELPLDQQNEQFNKEHVLLKNQLAQMNERCTQLLLTDKVARETEKALPIKKGKNKACVPVPGKLHVAQRKVLASLLNHWHGLIVFVDHPEVPMDNNGGERAIRGPVVGRKNFSGSGSFESAELTAKMYTQLQTVVQWGLNPNHWLQEYLETCAQAGGKAPADLTPFLPWEMSEERRQHLANPPPARRDST